MAVSENTGGTQAATISTEHTLATITAGGTFQLVVDLDNLANGDVVELRAKVKVRSSSTAKELLIGVYANDRGSQNVVWSPPIPAPHSVAFTLKQTAGTGRSFEWAVYEY